MASGFFFNGRYYITPTVVSAVNDSAMAPAGPSVPNDCLIIGEADAGEPNVDLVFGNPVDADAMLVSGPLRDAVVKAFNPSNETGSPVRVHAVRVGQATAATLTLNDASSTASVVITSQLYGLKANQVKAQVTAGVVAGKAVTVAFGNQSYASGDLNQTAFTATYTGASASATIQVGLTSTILVNPSGTTVATLAHATYKTVGQLCDAISSFAGWSATAAAGMSNKPTLNALDTFAAITAKSTVVTCKRILQQTVEWLNSNLQPLVTATRAAGAGAPPANIAWTYLAGATAPATQTSDWTNALNYAQTIDAQWLAVLSPDPAIAAATDAHVQYMSTTGQKERRAMTGPDLGTSISAVEALPIALNSDRTSVCWPGYYDYDADGNLTLYPPYMTAAVAAAGFAGLGPGFALTNKSMTFRGLEIAVKNPTDTDPLIDAGVMVFDAEPDGFRCVRSISTWQTNDNYNRVEQSCGAATDYMVRQVRLNLRTLKGQRGDPTLLGQAESITIATLTELAKPPPIGTGVIVGDANSPAFRNVTASLSGDHIIVQWEASPVIPVNFVGCAVSIVPYSGTASA